MSAQQPIAVVSDPWTTATWESVPKYQTMTGRVTSYSNAAVMPPIRA